MATTPQSSSMQSAASQRYVYCCEKELETHGDEDGLAGQVLVQDPRSKEPDHRPHYVERHLCQDHGQLQHPQRRRGERQCAKDELRRVWVCVWVCARVLHLRCACVV
jgi:hypothetical protein